MNATAARLYREAFTAVPALAAEVEARRVGAFA